MNHVHSCCCCLLKKKKKILRFLRNQIITYISAEGAATVLQLDHDAVRTVVEADLAEHLPLARRGAALLVQHERHLGAGPRVDSARRRGHRDDGGAAGALQHRGPGPGHGGEESVAVGGRRVTHRAVINYQSYTTVDKTKYFEYERLRGKIKNTFPGNATYTFKLTLDFL